MTTRGDRLTQALLQEARLTLDTAKFPPVLKLWRRARCMMGESPTQLAQDVAAGTGISVEDCARWLDDIGAGRVDLATAPAAFITSVVSLLWGWFAVAIGTIGDGDPPGLADALRKAFGKEG